MLGDVCTSDIKAMTKSASNGIYHRVKVEVKGWGNTSIGLSWL